MIVVKYKLPMCKDHPMYRAIHKPRVPCIECKLFYIKTHTKHGNVAFTKYSFPEGGME